MAHCFVHNLACIHCADALVLHAVVPCTMIVERLGSAQEACTGLLPLTERRELMIYHCVELEMDPVAKGRPKFRRGGVAYTPAKTASAERDIKYALMRLKLPFIADGAIAVELDFYLRKPKSSKRSHPYVRPDLDNLAKLVLDSANGILWADDSQICDLRLSKRYGSFGRISLRYRRMSE